MKCNIINVTATTTKEEKNFEYITITINEKYQTMNKRRVSAKKNKMPKSIKTTSFVHYDIHVHVRTCVLL